MKDTHVHDQMAEIIDHLNALGRLVRSETKDIKKRIDSLENTFNEHRRSMEKDKIKKISEGIGRVNSSIISLDKSINKTKKIIRKQINE